MFKAYAQAANVGCNPGAAGLDLADCYTLGLGSTDTVRETYGTPAVLFNIIAQNIFIFAGMAIFFMIFYAGYLYISDTAKGKEAAWNMLTTAFKGFILLFVSYWIVEIIATVTGIASPF